MKQTLTFLFVLVFFIRVHSQVHVFTDEAYRASTEKGMNSMYNMDFEAAEDVFLKLKNQYPEHPAGYFLLGFNRYWQTYMSETMPEYYPIAENYLATALKKNEKLEGQDEYYEEYVFFQFMSHALMARLFALRKSWFSGVNAARKLISPLKKSLKLVESHPEFYFAAGLYNYYISTYHKSYPVIRPFLKFFPEGDEVLGLEQMEKAAQIINIAQNESQFFLIYIYLDEINQPKKGLQAAKIMTQRFPQNTWIRTDYGRALIMNEKYTEGGKVLKEIEKAYQAIPSHDSKNITTKNSRYSTCLMIKVYHYLGQIAIYQDFDFEKALTYFNRSNKMARIAGVEEDNYLAGNEYYIGICYDNQSKRDKAILSYKKTISMEENTLYKDNAKKHIKAPFLLKRSSSTSSE